MTPTAVCHDLLPARPGSCRGAGLTFDHRTRVLDLATDRTTDRRYVLAELPVDRRAFRGRGFRLAKLAPGSDPEAGGYCVFVADAGPGRDSCECKGFLRHRHCSHADGLRALIANGWLEAPAERPAATPVAAADVDAMAAATRAA